MSCVSGFKFSEAQFGIVASTADVLPRVTQLISGEEVDGLSHQQVPLSGGALESDGTLTSFWDTAVYVINEPLGASIDLKVDSEDDVALYLLNAFGDIIIESDVGSTGIESGSAEAALDAPHFALVTLPGSNRGSFELVSNKGLAPYKDLQDGKYLDVGQTIRASMDYPVDIDYFYLNLDEGETVDITVESMNLDPILTVDYDESTGDVGDDDIGGGIFGTDSKLTFRAPGKARYTIVVTDATLGGIGGYILSVSEAPADAVPFEIAAPTPILDTPFGPMELYESLRYPFTIERPAFWQELETDGVDITAQFVDDTGHVFAIAEEDATALGNTEWSLEKYMDVVLAVLESTPGFELIDRENIVTAQGLPAVVTTASAVGDLVRAKRFVVMHNNRIGFSASYLVPKEKFAELEPMMDYSFSTFKIEGLPVTSATPAPSQAPARTVAEESRTPTLEIGFVGDSLKFDQDRLTVPAGAKVTVQLNNTSSVNQHNWVLVQPGTKDDVAVAGTEAGPRAEWILQGDPRIIAQIGLLDPAQAGEVRFNAPRAGIYHFTCTFPGHNFTEFGSLEVVESTLLSPTRGGSLVQLSSDPPTLDPHVTADDLSATIVYEVFGGLVTMSPELELMPDLAQSWDVSANGRVYKFQLRRDAKFHDGRLVTAEDVRWSLERATDSLTQSSVASLYLGDIIGVPAKLDGKTQTIEGLEVIDDYTIQLTLDAPKSYFLTKLTYPTGFVLDRKNVEANPHDWFLIPNGTGPFRLNRYDPGEVIVLSRNEFYHLGPPYLDEVRFILRAGNAVDMYENDEIHVSEIGFDDLEEVLALWNPLRPEIMTTPPIFSVSLIGLNVNEPPFDDRKFRQALNHAIDKNEIATNILGGLVLPAKGVIPPGFPSYKPDLNGYRYDPETAQKLFGESRYEGDPDNVPPIILTVSGDLESPVNLDIKAIIQSWRETLGIEVEIRRSGWTAFLQELQLRNIQMFSLGWIADYPDPQSFLDILFHSESSNNCGSYSNSELDSLLEKARIEPNQSLRFEQYNRIEQMIIDDAPWVPMWHETSRKILIKPNVYDYHLVPMNIPLLRYVYLAD